MTASHDDHVPPLVQQQHVSKYQLQWINAWRDVHHGGSRPQWENVLHYMSLWLDLSGPFSWFYSQSYHSRIGLQDVKWLLSLAICSEVDLCRALESDGKETKQRQFHLFRVCLKGLTLSLITEAAGLSVW